MTIKTCQAEVVPREPYGSFHQHPCGRLANDEEFPELCRMHGNARRREKAGVLERAAKLQTSAKAQTVAQAVINELATYGLPDPDAARPQYQWRGSPSERGHTGGIELTAAQAAWLLDAFRNGAEESSD